MKYMKTITLITLTAVGCAANPKQITGTILPTSDGYYLPYSIEEKPTGGWKPSTTIIKKAQAVIFQYIKDSDKGIIQ